MGLRYLGWKGNVILDFLLDEFGVIKLVNKMIQQTLESKVV